MKRIAGVDFGVVRIGIALSDENHLLSTPFAIVIAGKNLKASGEKLAQQLSQYLPLDAIVLGLPLHLSGKESPLSLQVRQFAQILEELFNTKVILWDERLTSMQVERTLKEAEMNRKKRSKYLDAMSAAAILQNYLDAERVSPNS
jgi:putative pre-16S rRNA nuclease